MQVPPCHPKPKLCCRRSVQGYGPKMDGVEAYVYPGSGATCDTQAPAPAAAAAGGAAAPDAPAPAGAAAAAEGGGAGGAAATASGTAAQQEGEGPVGMEVEEPKADPKAEPGAPAAAAGAAEGSAAAAAPAAGERAAAAGPAAGADGAVAAGGLPPAEEDPDHEFQYHGERARMVLQGVLQMALQMVLQTVKTGGMSELGWCCMGYCRWYCRRSRQGHGMACEVQPGRQRTLRGGAASETVLASGAGVPCLVPLSSPPSLPPQPPPAKAAPGIRAHPLHLLCT